MSDVSPLRCHGRGSPRHACDGPPVPCVIVTPSGRRLEGYTLCARSQSEWEAEGVEHGEPRQVTPL